MSGNQVFVNLTGASNAQTLVITLASGNDGINTRNDRFAPWEIGSFPKRSWNGIGCGVDEEPAG